MLIWLNITAPSLVWWKCDTNSKQEKLRLIEDDACVPCRTELFPDMGVNFGLSFKSSALSAVIEHESKLARAAAGYETSNALSGAALKTNFDAAYHRIQNKLRQSIHLVLKGLNFNNKPKRGLGQTSSTFVNKSGEVITSARSKCCRSCGERAIASWKQKSGSKTHIW